MSVAGILANSNLRQQEVLRLFVLNCFDDFIRDQTLHETFIFTNNIVGIYKL